MRILITGVCGFAGSTIAQSLLERREGLSIAGIDNLHRPGSETNRIRLRRMGVKFIQGDIRAASDFESLPAADWVIDAAANPSVLAGLETTFNSRQLFEHNLAGIVNVLEYCKTHRAGLVLLSSSRVYSIPALLALPLKQGVDAFHLDHAAGLPHGCSTRGIGFEFSTRAPVSLYGATKLACEAVALEYGEAFGFPVWIDRCGVLAGPGQFGTPEQGIFAYWINAHKHRRPLRYIGFDGAGKQVRDALHPRDLAALLDDQMLQTRSGGQRIYTVGGGAENSMSLAQLTAWCDARFGPHAIESDLNPRPYDIPWIVMDNADCQRHFGWQPDTAIYRLLEEIADHAERNPDWLERSGL
ncbi:MAG TPA: NAD-dependent epimerase/dehydratase family protein [Bryobacteraceae bacterium]|nr:NAD-dependent epimerase/dehydratase family protein [Bryobacteraceae bacterium]